MKNTGTLRHHRGIAWSFSSTFDPSSCLCFVVLVANRPLLVPRCLLPSFEMRRRRSLHRGRTAAHARLGYGLVNSLKLDAILSAVGFEDFFWPFLPFGV